MGLDKLFRDCKAESSATRLGGLVEPVEDPVDPVRRDAGARVTHLDRDGRGLRARLDAHAAATRCVADRVRDQVREDLARAYRIGIDLG